MKREAQPALSVEGQRAIDQYAHALQQMEDLDETNSKPFNSSLLPLNSTPRYNA